MLVMLAWGLQDILYCWNVYFENISQRVKSSHEIEFYLWHLKGHGFTQVGSSVKVQENICPRRVLVNNWEASNKIL